MTIVNTAGDYWWVEYADDGERRHSDEVDTEPEAAAKADELEREGYQILAVRSSNS